MLMLPEELHHFKNSRNGGDDKINEFMGVLIRLIKGWHDNVLLIGHFQMKTFIVSCLNISFAFLAFLPTLTLAQSGLWINKEERFLEIIDGKKLKRFLIELSVEKDGTIYGTGAGRPVTGSWQWSGEYFCRNLIWGEKDLGTDCQKIELRGQKLYFIANQGSGEQAGFLVE